MGGWEGTVARTRTKEGGRMLHVVWTVSCPCYVGWTPGTSSAAWASECSLSARAHARAAANSSSRSESAALRLRMACTQQASYARQHATRTARWLGVDCGERACLAARLAVRAREPPAACCSLGRCEAESDEQGVLIHTYHEPAAVLVAAPPHDAAACCVCSAVRFCG